MIEGKTRTGFVFKFDEANANDMRFVETLAKLEDNFLVFPKVITMLLGEEQKEALYKHIEDENGRVPVESMQAEFEDMMSANEETKNS